MRKKALYLLALVFGAGMMFSSCKDNVYEGDTPLTSEEEASEKGTEKGEALLSILNYTAGLDSLPDGWYQDGYTVEPTVGTVENEADPYVRYVSANSALSAYVTYMSMISGDVTGEAKDDSWSLDGIGKLKFTVSDQPDVYATVDVDVQQLPHLRQIRFVPPSALGENSSWFTGDPFYNFGDVVQDASGAYWICVRPADKPAKKSTTHWISFNMANDNFKECTKSGKAKLVLPDNLGDKTGSEEFIPDFVQFLKAISPGITVNGDKENIKISNGVEYHNVEISDVKRTAKELSMIANFWEEKDILNNADIIPAHVKDLLFNTIKGNSNLNVFYYGHHEGSTPDVHLLTIAGNNLIKTTKKEIKFEWPTAAGGEYSFNSYATSGKINENLSQLTIKTKNVRLPENAIVVRYKTGPQLSGSKTIWGNDEYPGKSFSGNSKNVITDSQIYKNRTLTSYYTLGDIVYSEENYGNFYCVKPAYSGYDNQKSNYAYFLAPSFYNNISGLLINSGYRAWPINSISLGFTHQDIKIVMFNLMNAYLLSEDENPGFSSSYSVCLKILWDNLHSDIKKAFSHLPGLYTLKLSFMSEKSGIYKFTVNYENGRYSFQYKYIGTYFEDDEGEDLYKEYPLVTLVYYADQGVGSQYLFNLTKECNADVVISAEEAAQAYKDAKIPQIEVEKE